MVWVCVWVYTCKNGVANGEVGAHSGVSDKTTKTSSLSTQAAKSGRGGWAGISSGSPFSTEPAADQPAKLDCFTSGGCPRLRGLCEPRMSTRVEGVVWLLSSMSERLPPPPGIALGMRPQGERTVRREWHLSFQNTHTHTPPWWVSVGKALKGSPFLAVPLPEEHPDVPQSVSRQVRPPEQRTLRPLRPL